jgi:uncharacterized delta-60 repeat protein
MSMMSMFTKRRFAAVLGLGLLAPLGCDDDNQATPRSDAAVDAAVTMDMAPGSEVRPPDTAPGTDSTPGTDSGPTDASGDAPPAPPPDRDVAVVRLLPTGALDTTFGSNGIAIIDLAAPAGSVRDDLYGLTVDAMGRPVLFGSRKGDGTRTDQDRVVARLTAAGALDTSFGSMGQHLLTIGTLNDNPRHGLVQPDNKIVMAGYTNQPTGVGNQTANAVVLLRLLDTGMPDTTFGANGIVNANPFKSPDGVMLAGMTEAYGITRQSTGNLVTVGYARGVGKAPTEPVDLVVNRWNASNGLLDTTFASGGALLVDVAGAADQGRYVITLPGDKLMVVGNAAPTAMNGDAVVVMVDANGGRDASFGTNGAKTYDFMRPSEFFYGAAVNATGTQAVAVGYRSGMLGGVAEDDDSLLLVLPLGAGGGTEVAKAVELSTSANDRFWGVAYGPDGKIYATGHVNDGGDHKMVVARFNTDGTLDTSFDTDGLVQINVAAGGTEETSRSIVFLTDGKILIGGPVDKK